MFEGLTTFFKKILKVGQEDESSKDTAKERLHLVLMQDRANVSADFLDLMKQEIIDVIKKYIEVDEKEIDVRLTNQSNDDGTNGAPALYANIPILNIRNDMKSEKTKEDKKQEEIKSEETKQEASKDDNSQNEEIKKDDKEQENAKEENKADVKEEKDIEKDEEKIENDSEDAESDKID